ncbi:DENN domain-containing protein 1A-like isoform X3 [Mya arenaria]|uniref:DENN domain-containing protein 1A-like isoform X3 n=1 Tax=Mya arenaria TaxID=6604 RepID=UPI0022E94E3D|nr:DENN domain-containing protein 1A-like isoform X3 [Mya arenaria]
MSRIRENPDKLFEVFFEIGKPTEDAAPFILQKYPLDFNDEEVIKSVPKFAFPCNTERYTTTVDHFSFVLTDLDSKFKFGYCRHATGAQTCLCIVSFLPWFEVFYNFLNTLAEITNRTDDNDLTPMLRNAYVQEVPTPGLPVTIVAGQEMLSFKAPDANKLPSIPASRNLLEYYNAIDTEKMMMIFASMLHERRIIVTSKKLSRLTAVIHAAGCLLYPMYWQHLYIPVLPEFLIDYLTAPMPFVIGVHSTLMERALKMELGDAVIVDADKNEITTEYNDIENLPDEMASYLKRHLKGEKVKASMLGSGDAISKTFMMSLVKLIGGYRDALKFTEGDPITFNPEAFVQSRPASMQPFLENMLCLQIFQQFINERLDMLNIGRGFADIFEQECLVHADKLNAQTRYNEWLGKMKKQGKKLQRGGKYAWSDFKVKARPAMMEARGFMDTVSHRAIPAMKEMQSKWGNWSHRVKTQGKKAYSKAKTKISDLTKEDDGSPKSGTPKSSKSVRHGPQTRSFSKEKPLGLPKSLSKDRPSTIIGSPIKSARPPRPLPSRPLSPSGSGSPPEIRSTFVSHINKTQRQASADDNDVMVYNRVSCNLMGDPDIQNMFKSASAENLPKKDIYLQSGESSDTLTSSSSVEGDLLHHNIPSADRNIDHSPTPKGDNSIYTHLIEDDDSGIVMRTGSQSSLEQMKLDAKFETKFESNYTAHGKGSSGSLHDSKEDQKPPIAPPRPHHVRKSVSPNVTNSPAMGDRLIRPGMARERPKPAPRRLSMENQGLPTPQPRKDVPASPIAGGDALIDFNVGSSGGGYDIATEFSNVDAAGDYVLLKEPTQVAKDHVDGVQRDPRRGSISRTPAVKYGQNNTPKRPSIRRGQSPISPGDPNQSSSLLDFDPLLDSFSETKKQEIPRNQSGGSINSNIPNESEDSLLKVWDIGHLTNLSTNTPNKPSTQSTFVYGHQPTPSPRNQPISRFYSPQAQPMTNRQTVHYPIGFQNTNSNLNREPTPQIPSKTANRNSYVGLSSQSASAGSLGNQSKDPFADLLSLNQSETGTSISQQEKPQKASAWETFK